MNASEIAGSDDVTDVVADSDEYFENACQPCESDNEHIEATGYCKQCHEFLCKTCIKYHGKVSKTKGHTILKSSEISKVKVAATSKDPLMDNCPKHDDEVIKYYCKEHDKLACSVCLSLDHRTCDAAYIPDISTGVKNGQEFQKIRERLQKMVTSVTENEETANEKIVTAGKEHDRTAADVKTARKNIDGYMKVIEKELLEEINNIKEKDKQRQNEKISIYQAWLSELSNILQDFDEKEKRNRDNALFIAMKQAEVKSSEVEKDIKQHGNVAALTSYTFEKDKILKSLHTTLKKSMKLKETDRETYAEALNVKSSSDKKDCYIGGILVLPNGKLVVADMDNEAVKLIDPVNDKIIARTSMTSPPFDVALMSNQEIAVTLGKEKKIQVIELPALTKLRSLPVNGACKGIACHEDKLFVVCQNPNAVQVLNLQGKKLHELNALFALPTRIALSSNGTLYVSDHIGQEVIHFTQDGAVIARMTDQRLRQPLGITFNPDDGCVYVVGWSSNNILQLTSSGEVIQTLYKEEDGLQKPAVIACKDKALFVSFDSSSPSANTIKVLEIK